MVRILSRWLLPVATLVLLAPLVSAVDLPDKTTVKDVDFERHIMGLFGRAGCNAGSCHGSFQRNGGLRLSLFGYDPDNEFIAITRDGFARRINSIDPDSSLLSPTASGQMERGGAARLSK